MLDQLFDRIGIDKGLSQSVVYDILQDKRGFMWFATQDGLNRFDGYKFRIYRVDSKSQGLKSNYIRKLYSDINGNLWLGTLGDGVFRYDRESDSITKIHFDGSENIIMCISQDERGRIWTGSIEGGLRVFDENHNLVKEGKLPFKIKDITTSQISCLCSCGGGNLLIGTWDSGIFVCNTVTGKVKNYRNMNNNSSCLSNDRVICIFKDSEDLVWIGTRNGLNRFNMNENTFEQYCNVPEDATSISENFVTCITEDKNNFLWIGTKNCGLNRFDKHQRKFRRFRNDKNNFRSISNDTISSLYCDESNVLWAGTFGGGINKTDCQQKKFYSLKRNNCDTGDKGWSNVLSIHKDKSGFLWIGTYNQGLFRVDSEGNVLERYIENTSTKNNITGLSITSIKEDRSGNLWIGAMRGGLNRFDIAKREFKFFPYGTTDGKYRVLSLCMNNNKSILLAGTSEDGLLKFNIEECRFEKTDDIIKKSNVFKDTKVNALHCDEKDILWIGTSGKGLIRFDTAKNELEFVTESSAEFQNEIINVICEDKNSNILAGTLKGIIRYEVNSGKLQRFTGDETLDLDIIKGIIPDNEGNIWISSGRGIVRFNLNTGLFHDYETADGLQSEEFVTGAFYSDTDGYFYFGGIDGINYFRPEEIRDNTVVPKIVITEFQLFNTPVRNSTDNPILKKAITETKSIELTYKESVFSFEFASLSYNNSDNNRYAYKMDGFDKDWIYCGSRRFVTYTNLQPGNYIFRVKGSNNDGVWNEEGVSIKICISPPFWKTWWFKSLGAAAIAGATGMAYRNKLNKIEKEKKSQEEFSRKLLDSQENERKKIAGELHDTIAHDILITKNKAVMGLRETASTDDVRKILNEISDLASNTLNDVRSISYNLHPHQIERLGLTKAIRSIVNRVAKSCDINFSEEIDNVDNALSGELEINVFRIIQECMNNILKHSNASDASIRVSKANQRLLIFISDNGKGFTKGERSGLGLRGISERVKLYDGTLRIESMPGEGTRIEISIPLK